MFPFLQPINTLPLYLFGDYDRYRLPEERKDREQKGTWFPVTPTNTLRKTCMKEVVPFVIPMVFTFSPP
jgi:hypothetical protein